MSIEAIILGESPREVHRQGRDGIWYYYSKQLLLFLTCRR